MTWRMKTNKARMNWKPRIQKLIGWRPKNERRTDEERQRTFTESLTETSQKRYRSTSARISFLFSLLFTKNNWNTQHRGQGSLKLSLLPLFIDKMGRRLSPSSPRRVGGFLKKLPVAPPKLISSPPPFRILWKSYGIITEAHQSWFSSSFSSSSQILSEICFPKVTKILRKPRIPVFNKLGRGACRPAHPGELSLPRQAGGLLRKFPDASPLLISSPLFPLLCFSLFSFRNITELATMGVKLSKAINWSLYANNNCPQIRLGLDRLFTPPPLY